MNSGTFISTDNLRIEIAVLQEEVNAYNPGKGKFRIPAIMTEDTVAFLHTSNKNILNRRNGNIKNSPINIDNNIELYIPLEYTFFYGDTIVPAGTKFLVSFTGANVNDIKIIGRYDESVGDPFEILTNYINESMKDENATDRISNFRNAILKLIGSV